MTQEPFPRSHGQPLEQGYRIRLGPETEIAGQAAFRLVFQKLPVVQQSTDLLPLRLDAQSMPLIAMDGDFDTLPLKTFAVSELEQDGVVLQGIDPEHEIIGPVADGKGQSGGLVDGTGHRLGPDFDAAVAHAALLGDDQREVAVGLDVIEKLLVTFAHEPGHGLSDTDGDRRDETGTILEDAGLHAGIAVFPVTGDQEEVGRRIRAFGFEKIISTLEERFGEGHDLFRRLQGHVEQTAGAQQPAQLVECCFHGRLVETHERGLDQIALDGDLEPEPGQDIGQKLDAQRSAVVGPAPPAKLRVT